MASLFISYRSADGADKATALARALGQRFGDDAVFIDKDDLRGGVAWRDEVGRTIGQRPLLLLLVTPQLMGATDATGRLRIADPDDPVRRELQAALDAGATLLPVLCDGVDALPPGLPPPFDGLAALTWRRLRAYDWAGDVQRLVDDALAHGVPALAPSTDPSATATPPRRRMLWAGTLAAVAAGSGLAWWWRAREAVDPFDGDFTATLAGDGELRMTLTRQGERVTLASAPVPIAGRADWADYRRFWHSRHGRPLDSVAYVGEGQLHRLPDAAPVADIALQVLGLPERTLVDSGNLNLVLQPDGRLAGTRWLNGTQTETPAQLVRRR